MIEFLQEISYKKTLDEIQSLVNKKYNLNLNKRQIESAKYRYLIKSYDKRGQYKEVFSDEIKEWIIENRCGVSRKEMLKLVNEKFDCDFKLNQINNLYDDYKIKNGIDATYKKAREHINFKEDGYESLDGRGRTRVKISDTKWRLKSHVVWESRNGPIPENYVLIYLDRDEKNWHIDNLALADLSTRGALANSKEMCDYPAINRVVVTSERLKTKIKKIENEV